MRVCAAHCARSRQAPGAHCNPNAILSVQDAEQSWPILLMLYAQGIANGMTAMQDGIQTGLNATTQAANTVRQDVQGFTNATGNYAQGIQDMTNAGNPPAASAGSAPAPVNAAGAGGSPGRTLLMAAGGSALLLQLLLLA